MPNKMPTPKTIHDRVTAALTVLLTNEGYLLENDLHERTIAHKFAEYLQIVFRNWHVDCEYNRDALDPKTITVPSPIHPEESEDIKVYPDIVIHRRGSKQNLLAIEIKKSSNRNTAALDFDREKLRRYREQLGYRKGLLVIFRTDDTLLMPYQLEWF